MCCKCMYQIWCSYQLGAVSIYDQVRSKLRAKMRVFLSFLRKDKACFFKMLTVALQVWPLNKTYTLTRQTAGSWARILGTRHLKRNVILFLCLVLHCRTRKLLSTLHTRQRDKIILRLLVWRTNRERASYVICNIIKNMSVKHFSWTGMYLPSNPVFRCVFTQVNANYLIWYQVTVS